MNWSESCQAAGLEGAGQAPGHCGVFRMLRDTHPPTPRCSPAAGTTRQRLLQVSDAHRMVTGLCRISAFGLREAAEQERHGEHFPEWLPPEPNASSYHPRTDPGMKEEGREEDITSLPNQSLCTWGLDPGPNSQQTAHGQ